MDQIASLIRDIPDFPKPGIIFKDITPLLADAAAMASVTQALAEPYRNAGITRIAGIESRGFIFGSLLAAELGCGFVPLRKPGKLPWRCRRRDYTLEYGTASLEIHEDAVGPADRVVIVDDLLATGGTMAAAATLVAEGGAQVLGLSCVIELTFLDGLRLLQHPFHALLRYP